MFDGGHTNLPVHESAAFLSFFCLVSLAVPSTERSPPPQAWPAPEAVACRGKRSEGTPHCQSVELVTACSTLPWQHASLSVAVPTPPHPRKHRGGYA